MTTKAIILAAGTGSRLRPMTDSCPKCMVSLDGVPILHRQIATLKACGIEDISIVGGYLSDKIDAKDSQLLTNPRYDSTNMVSTLFCARDVIETCETDLIISYGDIVFEPKVLNALIKSSGGLDIVVDLGWEDYWKTRIDNPLDDAETMKLNSKGEILELGKKAKTIDEIEGQYIGLIKIAKENIERFLQAYDALDRSGMYDGKDFENMYMTSFLQYLIDSGWRAKAVKIKHGWLELDTIEDYELYTKMMGSGEMKRFYDTGCLSFGCVD